jgi:hypothetical protein
MWLSGKAGKYGSSGSCSPCPANYFWCGGRFVVLSLSWVSASLNRSVYCLQPSEYGDGHSQSVQRIFGPHQPRRLGFVRQLLVRPAPAHRPSCQLLRSLVGLRCVFDSCPPGKYGNNGTVGACTGLLTTMAFCQPMLSFNSPLSCGFSVPREFLLRGGNQPHRVPWLVDDGRTERPLQPHAVLLPCRLVVSLNRSALPWFQRLLCRHRVHWLAALHRLCGRYLVRCLPVFFTFDS